MVQIIRNPCLPFTTPVSGGMYPGRSTVIRGTPFSGGEQRFSIDLLSCKGSLPLHFNPRFGYGGRWQIVLNSSSTGGHWANEECHSNILQIGVPFELQICVEEDKYRLTMNGYYFCDFRHRELPSNVNALRISGDVAIDYIKFPDYAPNYGAFGGLPSYTMAVQMPLAASFEGMKLTQQNYQEFNCPSVPFTAVIHGGVNPSRRVTIVGTPMTCADRFSVNLKCDNEFFFHFNPRFKECPPTVVRNSTHYGNWQMEERTASCFPFVPNQTFSLEICATGPFYNVTVNGQHFTTFASRDDPCRINQLQIDGDVSVQKVIIQ